MAVARRTVDQLAAWVASREGAVHRDDVLRAGFGVALIRELVRSGGAEMVRRAWVVTSAAPDDLRSAARAGGRVTCVSLARRRRWWVPEGVDPAIHLHMHPGSSGPGLAGGWGGVTHWTKPLAPSPRSLTGTVEDALQHIAACLDRDTALVLWESAARVEKLASEALRQVKWTSLAARRLADSVTGLSDSGLETLLAVPLRRAGLRVRQQVVLAGRPVDALVGERLVVQADGHEFHASSAQRTKDLAHDAELRLRGYTVLRFSYAQIVHEWPKVERTIRRAVASGLHGD